jgi:hypothetical protein
VPTEALFYTLVDHRQSQIGTLLASREWKSRLSKLQTQHHVPEEPLMVVVSGHLE